MASPQTSARDRIENLWDRSTPVGPLLDAYRDEIHIASIQDAIDRLHRIERLAPDSDRAPGINFAIGALMSIRDQKPPSAPAECEDCDDCRTTTRHLPPCPTCRRATCPGCTPTADTLES